MVPARVDGASVNVHEALLAGAAIPGRHLCSLLLQPVCQRFPFAAAADLVCACGLAVMMFAGDPSNVLCTGCDSCEVVLVRETFGRWAVVLLYRTLG